MSLVFDCESKIMNNSNKQKKKSRFLRWKCDVCGNMKHHGVDKLYDPYSLRSHCQDKATMKNEDGGRHIFTYYYLHFILLKFDKETTLKE